MTPTIKMIRHFKRLFLNPVLSFFVTFALLSAIVTCSEVLSSSGISEYSLTSLISSMEFSQVAELLSLILAADVLLLAFSGAFAAMILRYSVRAEERKFRMITFTSSVLVATILSVTALVTPVLVSSFGIVVSLVFLLTGVVELATMLVFSLNLLRVVE